LQQDDSAGLSAAAAAAATQLGTGCSETV
jgi:hypothetical protein